MIATVWAGIGLILIASEFFLPEMVMVFFGAGALFNALLVTISPRLSASIPLQIVTWLAASALALAGLRRRFAPMFRGSEPQVDEAEHIGRNAVVLEEISGEQGGRVTYAGTSWRALSFDETIPAGVPVTIIRKEGLTLFVTAEPLETAAQSDSGGNEWT